MGTITARKVKDGSTRYRASIRIKKNGVVVYRESHTFLKKTLASDWIKKREFELKNHEGLEKEQQSDVTVHDVLSAYEKTLNNFSPSAVRHVNLLMTFDIAKLSAVKLTPPDLIKYVTWRRETISATTAVMDLVYLRLAFRYAKTALGLKVNIETINDAIATLKQARLIGKRKARARRPTAEELEMLYNYFKNKRSEIPMHLVIWFAIYSCRRQSEIFRLKREDMHRESGTYLVTDVKHPDGSAGNDKTAFLPEQGWKLVDEILKIMPPDELLLPFNPKRASEMFTRACKILGISGLRFHDLRHEGASRLAEDGKTIPEIQQVTLHDSWSSLSIYVNVMRRKERRLDYSDLEEVKG